MLKDGVLAENDFRNAISEVGAVHRADVGFEHRRLPAFFDDDEVARVSGRARFVHGRDEQKVNRPLGSAALRYVNKTAILEKGRVQGRKRVICSLSVLAKMLLEQCR